MILTDRFRADIDERNPQHLCMDAKKVAEELHSLGIIYYCNSLDPSAHHFVQLIFGKKYYKVIHNVQSLPDN